MINKTNMALYVSRLNLESIVETIINTKTSIDSHIVLKSNLKHWMDEYSRLLKSDNETLKTTVLLETNACIRATLISLSQLDEENKDFYDKALLEVTNITTFLRQKELNKINKITKLLNSN